jgi:hypothetical protein
VVPGLLRFAHNDVKLFRTSTLEELAVAIMIGSLKKIVGQFGNLVILVWLHDMAINLPQITS